MSITRHATYNLAGFIAPSLLALATVPAYIHLLGPERYGVLALVWAVLGYFGLFDLGLGRAATQRIAALADAPPEERARALVTALGSNLAIGMLGALIMVPVAGVLFARGFSLPAGLRREALECLPMIAIAVPLATTIGVLNGALLGRSRFAESNRIGVFAMALFQLVPLALGWQLGPALPAIVASAVAMRALSLVFYWRACRRDFGPVSVAGWSRSEFTALLAYGGWVTLTSLFAPVLTMADRFVIGSLLGAREVTFYSVPMDLTQRLGGVAGSLGSALFPRLAVATGEEASRLTALSVSALYALLTPPIAAGLVLADPLLRLWLGDAVGMEATPIARLLLVAVWFNAFAQMPYVQLQAQGRPDVVGKLLVAETPFYLAALWFGVVHAGLWGAALAFLARIVADALLLFLLAGRRIERAGLLLATLALFTAACFGMRDLPPLPLAQGLGWGLLVGVAMLVPGWFALPREAVDSLRRMAGRQSR